MQAKGYDGLTRIHEGGQAIVYRARRQSDGQAVILKMLRGPYPTPEARARFRFEYDITRSVAGPGVVAVEGWTTQGGVPSIVLEDFGGRALDQLWASGPPPVDQALQVAESLVRTLERLHRARVIHLDINPSNIVASPDGGTVKFIDFGLSTTLPRQTASIGGAHELRGTLRYVAPEQTGRMNRSLDYRSDYYSLGATLYWLFTGTPPFQAEDPLELVHAHIAREPEPADARRPGVPPCIAAVIGRLLAKSAEDRYQSAFGILADLAQCRRIVAGELPAGDFTVAAQDRPLTFRIPERLYGRESELDTLVAAFARAQAGGREVVLVEGSSGMGKSSLVREVQRPIVAQRGVFVSGKFDQFKRDIPYASLSQALRQVVQLVLTGQHGPVSAWRDAMLESVGPNGAVLTHLIPELDHILGEQPPAPELPDAEAEARLHRTMQRFVRVLATAEHPLVLFMDDLQWADRPSIGLIRLLALDPDGGHVLIIGAVRPDELPPGHPLPAVLSELEDAGRPALRLQLRPMDRGDCASLLADTLHRTEPEVAALAALCRDKTGGNPFFLHRFVHSLASSGFVRFDQAARTWGWDLRAVKRVDVTDNVVAFLAGRLALLPEAAQRQLEAAAVLGGSFGAARLAGVQGTTAESVCADLQAPLLEGLIEELGADRGARPAEQRRFRFQHDRIQQAAYERSSPAHRERLHLAAGRLLLAEEEEGGAQSDLFELVGHLNAGIGASDDPEERERLAELDHIAGIRALSASAYAPAWTYLRTARVQLGEHGWAKRPGLMRAVTIGSARAAYLTGNIEQMESLVDEAIAHAETVEQRVRAMRVRIDARIAMNRTAEAIHTGIEALALLGLHLPEDPVESDVAEGLGATFARVGDVDLQALLQRPAPDDPSTRLAMGLLSTLAPPAYFINPMLVPLLAFELVKMTVSAGPTPDSAYGFSLLGLVLCNIGKLEEGYHFGRLSMDLGARFEDKRLRVRATHVFFGFVRHWKEPAPAILPDYAELFHQAVDVGDYEYAGYAGMMYGIFGFYTGSDLARLEPSVAYYTKAMTETGQEASLAVHGILHQAIRCVLGRADDPTVLTGEIFDEPKMLAAFEAINDPTCLFVLHCVKAMLYGVAGQWSRVLEMADACAAVSEGGAATLHLVLLAQWDALASLARAAEVPVDQRTSLIERADAALAKLDTYAHHNPEAHGHRPVLIRAERAALTGERQAAMEGYERAASLARERQLTMDEALANERAGRMFLDAGLETVARSYLVEARYAWQRWGAAPRVQTLEDELPWLLGDVSRAAGTTETTGGDSATVSMNLDVMAVIRASQAISKEIHLERLIERVVRIAMEVSGARAALVVNQQSAGLTITARGVADPSPDVQQRPVLLRDSGLGPESIIRYVERTREELVLDDASASALFASDPYISAHGVRSVLCLPVEQQRRLLAVLYLEHASARSVFTQQRVGLLRVLLAQAAISVENATLIDNLEEKVRERTRELEEARRVAEGAMQRSDDLLRNILPDAVAEELKQNGAARPVSYPAATVLFTDFVGFTRYAATVPPEELIAELEACFSAFDDIADRWSVEKLKTIGDAWMAAAGIPSAQPTHALDAVMAALEIRTFMARRRAAGTGADFAIRIGLHTGPLVAGVIGSRRFAYDVWGDTVNTAARMESAGGPGRINVSAATWALVQDFFVGTPRGALAVKGKGELEMVFIEGLRPELSIDGAGERPNTAFHRKRATLARG
jgi:predicted ATPase/class 3 adenylate cyclase/tRNA A-37 threonylcarbamoyl transferase component Bud32